MFDCPLSPSPTHHKAVGVQYHIISVVFFFPKTCTQKNVTGNRSLFRWSWNQTEVPGISEIFWLPSSCLPLNPLM